MQHHFNAALFGYDEVSISQVWFSLQGAGSTRVLSDATPYFLQGFLTDDRVLAAAVWRNLLARQHCDLEVIETLVKYIRVQVKD